jgi:hypothetical protein
MFEKYIGRKETPRITIKPGESSIKAAWLENAINDPEFMDWFSGSVVSDNAGNPIPVFHGTRNSRAFDDIYKAGVYELGMHFGSIESANDRLKDTFDSDIKDAAPDKATYQLLRDHISSSRYRSPIEKELELAEQEKKQVAREQLYQERISQKVIGGEKVYPVFLRITKPVRIKDPGFFSPETLRYIKKDLIKNFVTRDQVEKIRSVKTIDELRDVLKEFGYDGVVYENGVEGRGSDSYIPIVGPNQIRSVFQNPPDNTRDVAS